MTLNVKKIHEDAQLPRRGSDGSAGYDLCAVCENEYSIFIPPHETVMVSTGLALEIPEGYFGAIFARSGIATKRSLRPANCVGVIDSDYRGEIIVALHNDSEFEQVISDGERIAQLVIIPYLTVNFFEVDTLEETIRGSGGFGSTGEIEMIIK